MRIHNWLAGAGILLTVAACSNHNASDDTTAAAATASAQADDQAVAAETPKPAPGPDMLTTVGLFDGNKVPVTEVEAVQARFALEDVNGIKTLTVNGKPALFKPEGVDQPVPIEANSDLILLGAFELPQESVAWALVVGGGACPGNHILIGARNGVALPGQPIPGCDDRGTMRRSGDKITFEAGGSTGTYQNGMVAVETNANAAM